VKAAMNKYEQRAEQQRRSAMRSSMMMGTAGIALLAVVLLIVGLNNSAPQTFFSRAAVGVAILLLVLRQVSRRLRGKAPRAAQPDPQSKLNLNG
jgi:Flp pilus assembly protein protease CpaA